MDNIWVQILFWIGLAMIVAGSFYFPRRMLKKKKQLDERYEYIHHLGRSYGWIGSLFIVFVTWFLSIAVFQSLITFWFISIIYVGHMLSYLIGTVIANDRN